MEKEGLLVELQQLQESTNAVIAALQSESKKLAQEMNQMARELQEASTEKAELVASTEQEKVLESLLAYPSINLFIYFLCYFAEGGRDPMDRQME